MLASKILIFLLLAFAQSPNRWECLENISNLIQPLNTWHRTVFVALNLVACLAFHKLYRHYPSSSIKNMNQSKLSFLKKLIKFYFYRQGLHHTIKIRLRSICQYFGQSSLYQRIGSKYTSGQVIKTDSNLF